MSGGPIRRGAHALALVIGRSGVASRLDRFPIATIRRVVFSLRIGGVLETLDTLEAAGVRAWLAGGWGVDALLGRTTRWHSDVDIVLDVRDDPVAAARTALGSIGLDHVDDDAEGGRWMPQLVKVTDRRGAVVDLLPVDPTRLPAASPFTMGVLAGRRVPCLSAELQVAFHRGYRRRWSQQRDLTRLCAWSGDARPLQPPGPLGRWRRRLGHRLVRAWQRLLPTDRPRESALLILVPAADDLVRESRHASSDAGADALPPHITVLYPFVPASRIDGDLERDVAAVAEGFPPFSYRLARVGRFPDVVYVAPEPAAPFVDLSNTFAAYWPEHPPYGGVYDEPIPHMTLVDAPGRQDAPQAIERHLPVEATAAELALMVEGDDGRWRVLRQFPLGGDRSDACSPPEQPVTAQTTTTIRTEVRPSLHGVEELWDALVDQAPLASPFLRSWWLEAVVGDRPCFVLVFDGDRLLGGAALEEKSVLGVKQIRMVGFRLAADHLDLVADPERIDDVVTALRGWCTRPGSRMFDLVGLSERNRLVGALPSPVRSVLDHAPWSPLPATFDEYLDERPSRLRSLVDRPRRRLERAGAELRVVDVDDADAALARLHRLHELHWAGRSEFTPQFARFARAARVGVARGELVIHELWVGEDVVASQVSFDIARRLSYYQGGHHDDRRWRGAGTWLMALVVADACKRGCEEFDLLRGSEPYKEQWTSDRRAVTRATATHGARARILAFLSPSATRARNRLRRLHLIRKAST